MGFREESSLWVRAPSSTLNHLPPQAAPSLISPFCVSQMLPGSLGSKKIHPVFPKGLPAPRCACTVQQNPRLSRELFSMDGLRLHQIWPQKCP